MAIQPRRTQRRPYATLTILIAAIGLIGWCLYPVLEGEPARFPFQNRVLAAESDDEIQPPAEGKVRVLISGRPMDAYAKVSRADIWDANRGTVAFVDLDAAMVEANGIFTDASQIVGRVLASDKDPGYAFRERDFLPEGTRPGLSAGVPPGKRALRVEVEKVQGIVGLQPGDRFDIFAAWKLEENKAKEQPNFVGLYKHLAQGNQPKLTRQPLQVLSVVRDGVVVSPLHTRMVPTSSSTLTSGTTTRTLPVQEMVIALEPEEVPLLLEAFALEADVECVAQSGLPREDSTAEASEPIEASSLQDLASQGMPEPEPEQEMKIIEQISGSRRDLVPVPVHPPN